LKFGLYSIDEFGNHFTPLDQLHFVIDRMIMLVQWTSLPLVLGYIAAFVRIAGQRQLSFLDFVFPLLVLGFMLFPALGGDQYGPRYYFDGFPLLVLTVVAALAPILQDAAHPHRPLLASLVMTHGALCIAAAVGLGIAFRTIVDQRLDLYDQVKAEHLRNAVVVIHSSTGRDGPMTPTALTRNGIALDGKIIYALDIPHRLADLRRLFPDRRFYIYERKFDSAKGTLRPLR
jgi:hypothetical protein